MISGYKIKMTDQEIIEFCDKCRADGNIKYDIWRHRALLFKAYINLWSKHRKSVPMYKAWIRRLQNIVKGNPKLWENDSYHKTPPFIGMDMNDGEPVTVVTGLVSIDGETKRVELYRKH